MSNKPDQLEEYINQLIPFKDLPSGDRNKLAKTGELVKKTIGENLYATECQNYVLYLLRGKLDICRQYLQPQLLLGQSAEALRPIFSEYEEKETHISIQSSCEIWRFDRDLVNRLIEKEVIVEERVISHHMGHVEGIIYSEIMQAVEKGGLKLPSLPEIALRIKKAVEESEVDVEQIAKIVELDPAISTRLIKVANSPLTRGVNPIHTMRDVIVRLGLKMTRNLVLSFSVAQLFKTQHPFLKKQMKKFYAHSIEIASICYALGKHIKTMDADELLLAGLVHDIGIIPVITYIEKTGLEVTSEEEILRLIASLRVAVGVLVIKSWDLPNSMLNVVSHAEHWYHDSGKDMKAEDVIIIAQVYDKLRRKQLTSLPDINKVPAFKKLFPEKHDPAFAMQVLDEAREEIKEMKGLLGI
jgi:HD-like signal output (HDOD) protein